MAIQQKAQAQKENFSSQDALTYRLSSTAKSKGKDTPVTPHAITASTNIKMDLIQTVVVFLVSLILLGGLYLRLR